jgi:LuxR family maltose regulon positive regulatory protein
VAASVADARAAVAHETRRDAARGAARTFAELDEPLVLVVDDFHHVRAAGVLDPLAKIIARAPEHLHVVLACRRDPDMTLHRLRLGGMMAELRAREMAFTEEEAGAFLEAAGVDIRPELTTALVDRTEGWAAALRFAAMSLRERANAEPFVRALARTEQAVSDYLVSEVLAAQPTPPRPARTSLCERIDGDLADALTGGSDGSRTLAALERDNVFVELQQDDRWYRYHPLFAELLATEARHELGDETLELHRIAARRLAGSGDRLAALRHAVASGDPALASGSWPGSGWS